MGKPEFPVVRSGRFLNTEPSFLCGFVPPLAIRSSVGFKSTVPENVCPVFISFTVTPSIKRTGSLAVLAGFVEPPPPLPPPPIMPPPPSNGSTIALHVSGVHLPSELFSTTTLSGTKSGDEPPFSLCFPSVTAAFSCHVSAAITFCPDAPFSPAHATALPWRPACTRAF